MFLFVTFQFESEQNTDFDHDYKITIILPFAKETWPQNIWKIIILYLENYMYISLEGLQTGEWKEKFLVVSTCFFFMATEFSYQD